MLRNPTCMLKNPTNSIAEIKHAFSEIQITQIEKPNPIVEIQTQIQKHNFFLIWPENYEMEIENIISDPMCPKISLLKNRLLAITSKGK